jgi:hypothetical protein
MNTTAGPKMRKWYGQESGLPRDGGQPEPPKQQVRARAHKTFMLAAVHLLSLQDRGDHTDVIAQY